MTIRTLCYLGLLGVGLQSLAACTAKQLMDPEDDGSGEVADAGKKKATGTGTSTGSGSGTGSGNGSGTGSGNGDGTGTGTASGSGSDAGSDAGSDGSVASSDAGDAGVKAADGGDGGLKAFGAPCTVATECVSGACFVGGMESYCSITCTAATQVTDCPVPPTSGTCNKQLYCKK